jgi:hypothetical protein
MASEYHAFTRPLGTSETVILRSFPQTGQIGLPAGDVCRRLFKVSRPSCDSGTGEFVGNIMSASKFLLPVRVIQVGTAGVWAETPTAVLFESAASSAIPIDAVSS